MVIQKKKYKIIISHLSLILNSALNGESEQPQQEKRWRRGHLRNLRQLMFFSFLLEGKQQIIEIQKKIQKKKN